MRRVGRLGRCVLEKIGLTYDDSVDADPNHGTRGPRFLSQVRRVFDALFNIGEFGKSVFSGCSYAKEYEYLAGFESTPCRVAKRRFVFPILCLTHLVVGRRRV